MSFLLFLTFYSDPASVCRVAYSQVLEVSPYLDNLELFYEIGLRL